MVAFFPNITSTSDIILLQLPKEIIADRCDYQYASSQFLRHVNYIGEPCTCLSELAPMSDMSKFTSDDHASLVIRVIQCIAARNPSSKAGQDER